MLVLARDKLFSQLRPAVIKFRAPLFESMRLDALFQLENVKTVVGFNHLAHIPGAQRLDRFFKHVRKLSLVVASQPALLGVWSVGMKPGDVSDVIRTRQGYVILKVTEHTAAGIPPMKDLEPQIQDAIYMQKLQPALRAYLTKLREDAFIDIKSGYTDSAASPNESKPIYTSVAKPEAKKKRHKKLGIF